MRPNPCPYCEIEPRVLKRKSVYCEFCYKRFSRMRSMFSQAGRKFSIQKTHRAWNHWKQSPALDALYLDPEGKAA